MSSLLIDTNLLLLLLVGLTNKEYISSHKRTKNFSVKDFDLLIYLMEQFSEIWTTSHCMAEVSNLLRQTNDGQAEELMWTFQVFSSKIKESHICKQVVFSTHHYLRLGITDAGLIKKAKRVSCSLTTDLDLYLAISKSGHNVKNFNHLRQEYLLK